MTAGQAKTMAQRRGSPGRVNASWPKVSPGRRRTVNGAPETACATGYTQSGIAKFVDAGSLMDGSSRDGYSPMTEVRVHCSSRPSRVK